MGVISCFICVLEAWWTTDKEYHTHGRSSRNGSVLTVPVPERERESQKIYSGFGNKNRIVFGQIRYLVLVLKTLVPVIP
jgi:hypothetical protein